MKKGRMIAGVGLGSLVAACIIVGGKYAHSTVQGMNQGTSQNSESVFADGSEHCWQLSDEKRDISWICYESKACEQLDSETKKRMAAWITEWTQGHFTDDELSSLMTDCVSQNGLDIHTAGISSRQICLFESEEAIPDYAMRVRDSDAIYDFIGLYTEGDVDRDGNLICYFWEAGIR